MFTNRHPIVQRPPVVLVCEACGHEGCRAAYSDDPDWYAHITCPACGHVQHVGWQAPEQTAKDGGLPSQTD